PRADEKLPAARVRFEWTIDGSAEWVKSSAGEEFNVPGNSKFEIRVTEPYHYICHFG
ncbi:MAG: pyrimidine/purine nucleoside phosphorylase, partial [Burkholderiales bacterium]